MRLPAVDPLGQPKRKIRIEISDVESRALGALAVRQNVSPSNLIRKLIVSEAIQLEVWPLKFVGEETRFDQEQFPWGGDSSPYPWISSEEEDPSWFVILSQLEFTRSGLEDVAAQYDLSAYRLKEVWTQYDRWRHGAPLKAVLDPLAAVRDLNRGRRP